MRLPDGRAGQATAVALTLLGLGLVWFGMIAPTLDWYAERATALQAQQIKLRRMTVLIATLPDLRNAADAAGQTALGETALLAGSTDALAAASLQQTLNEHAHETGVTLSSQEILPPQPAGGLVQVTVRIALNGPYPGLIRFMLALAQSEIPLVVTELQIHGTSAAMARGQDAADGPRSEATQVEATLSVMSFRDGAAGGG